MGGSAKTLTAFHTVGNNRGLLPVWRFISRSPSTCSSVSMPLLLSRLGRRASFQLCWLSTASFHCPSLSVESVDASLGPENEGIQNRCWPALWLDRFPSDVSKAIPGFVPLCLVRGRSFTSCSATLLAACEESWEFVSQDPLQDSLHPLQGDRGCRCWNIPGQSSKASWPGLGCEEGSCIIGSQKHFKCEGLVLSWKARECLFKISP